MKNRKGKQPFQKQVEKSHCCFRKITMQQAWQGNDGFSLICWFRCGVLWTQFEPNRNWLHKNAWFNLWVIFEKPWTGNKMCTCLVNWSSMWKDVHWGGKVPVGISPCQRTFSVISVLQQQWFMFQDHTQLEKKSKKSNTYWLIGGDLWQVLLSQESKCSLHLAPVNDKGFRLRFSSLL